jgi:uncharacterized membrane protein
LNSDNPGTIGEDRLRLSENHMEDSPSVPPVPFSFPRWLRIAIVLLLLAIIFVGWQFTPSGLLGKADAIGYAVCHRIDARSFHLGDRELPLCARCTGTFLAAFLGIVFLFAIGRGRSATWPSHWITGFLMLAVLPWGIDGLNSYLSFFPQLPHLYQPQNWLRLTTGTFLGLAVAALFLPAVNQSLWKNPTTVPILKNVREFLAFLLIGPIVILTVLTENLIVLYPLAILSVMGVLFLLTGVYSAGLLMLLKREGQFSGWEAAWPILVAGLTLGLLQIGAIDFLRYALTQTWGGFQLGG